MYLCNYYMVSVFFFFKQKTAYEMRISDWSSDVCSSDLSHATIAPPASARISAVSAKKSFSRSSIAVSVRPKKLRLHHGEQWLSLALLAPAGRWEGGANLSCAAA